MKYTDEQLLNRVKSLKSFKGCPKGILDIWIRSKADNYNQFDDKVYTFECFGEIKRPIFIMVGTGTSNAGSFGLKNFRKYNSKGCAVLCADTIVLNSHVPGLHKGKPAYIQSFSVGFPYTRDNDGDDKAENYGKIYYDRIGANCHRAGWLSTLINNWSVGCLVRNNLTQFLKWMSFMQDRPLSVAILNEF